MASFLLQQLFVLLPRFLVIIIALAILPRYWQRLKSAAVLLLIALMADLILISSSFVLEYWFHSQLEAGENLSQLATRRALLHIPLTAMGFSAWVLLIVAVFAGRSQGRRP